MSGLAIKKEVSVLTERQIESVASADFCACYDCDYVEKVFAGDTSRKNDTSSFLFKKIRSADAIALELHRKCSKVADLNDNTLGVYYSAFTAQPLYVGFVIDWGLVFDAYTGGEYTIVANSTILGVASTTESRKFYLNSYDDVSANDTVRIEIMQDGNIISDQFDYTDLIAGGWGSQYRIPATFGYKSPELTTDSYQSSDRKNLNIQPSVSYEYTLKARLLPSVITDILSSNAVLADAFKITSYSINTPRLYTDFDVFPKSIEKLEEYNKRELYEVVFSEKVSNTIKQY